MNVLFVCRNNTGRSQVAMEFFKQLSDGKTASAGTQVEEPEKPMKDRPGAATIVQAMKEYQIDMSDNPRVQVTESMLDGYDKIVIMAEPSTVPDWLSQRPEAVWWDVMDIKNQPLDVARALRDQILDKVGMMLGYNKEQIKELMK